MNFFAMATLKKVRACFRRPISMMPRFSLKLMLARLRTGMARVGSLLRSAAVITASATLMSFFSTGPGFLAFGIGHGVLYLFLRFGRLRPALRGLRLGPGRSGRGLALGRLCLGLDRLGLDRPGFGRPAPPCPRRAAGSAASARAPRPAAQLGGCGARQHRRLPFGTVGSDDDRVGQALRSARRGPGSRRSRVPPVRFSGDLLELGLELLLRQLAALQPGAGLDDLLDVQLEDVAPAELALGALAPAQEHARAGARTPAARA